MEQLSLDSMAVLLTDCLPVCHSVTCHLLFCIILQIYQLFQKKHYFDNSKQILEGDWKMIPSAFFSKFGITDHKTLNRLKIVITSAHIMCSYMSCLIIKSFEQEHSVKCYNNNPLS